MEDVYASTWRPRNIVQRRTVDLRDHPDLVVIYLGMRVNTPRGILTIVRFARALDKAIHPRPDGLLHHERLIYSPRQLGWRQYWRDLDSMLAWARSHPHRGWWTDYLREHKGAGIWHETYSMRGGMEAVFDAMPVDVGLAAFAPQASAEGTMFPTRHAKPPP